VQVAAIKSTKRVRELGIRVAVGAQGLKRPREYRGKKPQVPPLRCAPVGMTILSRGQVFLAEALAAQQNCHPESL
jgi:hypothetical protein